MKNIQTTKQPNRMLEIKVIDFDSGKSYSWGFYPSVLDLSLAHPITAHGTDAALMSRMFSPNSEVFIYQIVDGKKQEIEDPRVCIEDLDLLR